MIRTLFAVSSLLGGIGILLMGLALASTSLGVRAVGESYSDSVTGFIMACYFGGFILGSYLCPQLVRRVGPIRTFAALAAVASASTFMFSILVNPLSWAILRFLIGFCLVGLYMVLESWLNYIAPNDKRGRIFAAYMIVTLAAHAFGQFLLLLDPKAETIAFGIAAVFLSLGLVPIALTRLPEPKPVSAPTLHFRALLFFSPLSVAGALAGGLATSGFWALGAVFAERIGLDSTGLITFMVTTITGGVILQWPIGRISDHIDRRYVLLAVSGLASSAALFAGMVHSSSNLWLYVSTFLLGGLLFPVYSLSVAYMNDRVASDDLLEATRGILLVYGAGALLGPILAGMFMHYLGPHWLFYYQAIVLLCFFIYTIIRIQHSDAVPEEDRSHFVPVTRTSQAALEMDPRLDEEHEGHPEGLEEAEE